MGYNGFHKMCKEKISICLDQKCTHNNEKPLEARFVILWHNGFQYVYKTNCRIKLISVKFQWSETSK